MKGSDSGWRRLASLTAPALFVLTPLLGASRERMLHPGPWVVLAAVLIIFWAQPSIPRWQLLTARGEDRRTGLLILVVAGICTSAPTADFAYRATTFPAPLSRWVIMGTIIISAGTAMRVWAVRTLGRHFTGLVTVDAYQPVIDRGPYALLRHPAYSGSLLACIGGAVLFESIIALVLTLIVAVPTYLFRIRVEEKALCDRLGGAYARYRARTWMLIPFVL